MKLIMDVAPVVAHARAAAPDECCGILVGHAALDAIVVERVVRARNVDPEPRSGYVVAPADLLAAIASAERGGLDVVGFYHSHPAGPPHLSERDRALASWEGAAYVLTTAGTTKRVSVYGRTRDETRKKLTKVLADHHRDRPGGLLARLGPQ